jgi:ABC-type Fe3+-siderophore transport system permease subunit
MLKTPITTPEFDMGLGLLAGLSGLLIGVALLLDPRYRELGAVTTLIAASNLIYMLRKQRTKQ